ncbi:MAG TPA: GntR family transcriptional regulator [Ramlibacter sp.]|uniref:GntR family transcriptional regulator n=1 Tax=Ramlibacter sp. TaxID=1917967 RepID=UPI002CE2B348|nr:GntR family transcriptional regulator [Ramlibacter sp.]HVZ44760.1 GntR family transcriptional regulator [Ramlibacter sp.]
MPAASASASPILARFAELPTAAPKHARLRDAIASAVESGELPVGSKVTGERELSEALGLSLGTTQKALGRLMEEGFLVRKHGHGTFVGRPRKAVAGSWHFRFVPPEGGAELPVFTTVVEREIVAATGPWSEVLGADPKGYVLLKRQVDIDGRFLCASRMYLPASRFGRLVRMAAKRLADTNLKEVLAEEFAAPTLSSDGLAFTRPIEAADARLMRIKPGTVGLQAHITGRTFARVPITFQVMSVPQVPYALKLDFNPPGA